MPKLVKDMATYGAAWSAVRHSPAAGGLAQEEVSGEIFMMSPAVMVPERLKGDADVVAASARMAVVIEKSILFPSFLLV